MNNRERSGKFDDEEDDGVTGQADENPRETEKIEEEKEEDGGIIA